jgi:hypothetical protein
MNVDPATLDTKAVAAYTGPGKMQSTTEFLLNVIPNTIVDAFAKGEILQVLLFAILFGFALHALGARGKPLYDIIDTFSHALFGIVGIIMKVAPIGAFGAMAFTIGAYGVGTLVSLGKLMACFCDLPDLHLRRARHHRPRTWLLDLEVHQVHQGGIVHRARHVIVGIGAAANDRQAREPRRAEIGRRLVIPAVTRSTSMARRSISRWRPYSSRRRPTRHST